LDISSPFIKDRYILYTYIKKIDIQKKYKYKINVID
jgi:hypothetical protein